MVENQEKLKQMEVAMSSMSFIAKFVVIILLCCSLAILDTEYGQIYFQMLFIDQYMPLNLMVYLRGLSLMFI
jgi:hypothetical protein